MDILFPFLTSADGPAYHGRTCISPSLIPQASRHKIIYYHIHLGVYHFIASYHPRENYLLSVVSKYYVPYQSDGGIGLSAA